MSLLHDLAESITGDFTPDSISKKDKVELENKTMNEILNNLPDILFEEYMAIWKEYQDKKTKESVLMHEVDKLEMALQAKIYSNQGFSKEKLESFLKTADKEIQNNDLKTIFEDIVKTI